MPAYAHNGAVAHGVPVANIVIDGDFSEWPKNMPQYVIQRAEYGDTPWGREDFQAWFQFGYDAQENAVYIAVMVNTVNSFKKGF